MVSEIYRHIQTGSTEMRILSAFVCLPFMPAKVEQRFRGYNKVPNVTERSLLASQVKIQMSLLSRRTWGLHQRNFSSSAVSQEQGI